jgi:hypothetical protein
LPRRLTKYVTDSTTLSVAQARAARDAGRIAVECADGSCFPISDPDALVFAEDRVSLDGNALVMRTEHYYAILNKPQAII